MKRITAIILLFLFVVASSSYGETKRLKGTKIAFLADVHLQDIYRTKDTPSELRSLADELRSTRLFNENYFAFIAALDDIVKRDIKLVILPGDLTDDGQIFNELAVQRILNDYSKKYGISFFSITGNHDPSKPFSEDPAKMGYEAKMSTLSEVGFYPQPEYKYWESPFTTYNYDSYSFDKARTEGDFKNRQYIMHETGIPLPDASYLVEPIEGLWLLAIDASVFVSRGITNGQHKFSGTGNGYNMALDHKKHILPWVTSVAERAKKMDKVLIAFGHYPLVEFNNGASEDMRFFFGDNKFDLSRIPSRETSEIFADKGIKLHFAGHIHIDNTGVITSDSGNSLINVQVPSLAAYLPAYKILTIKGGNIADVETIPITAVNNFDALFPIYKQEHDSLKASGEKAIWNSDILSTKTYEDFTAFHLEELVRLRYLPNEFPASFNEFFLNKKGGSILQHAIANSNREVKLDKIDLKEYNDWSGFDMICDYFKLRGAGENAKSRIGALRLTQYNTLIRILSDIKQDSDINKQLYYLSRIFDKSLSGTASAHFSIDLSSGKIVK